MVKNTARRRESDSRDAPLRVFPRPGRALAAVIVTALTASCWLLPEAIGDAGPSRPYWLLVPAVIAASWFGLIGALAGTVVCGLLAGPMTAVFIDTPRGHASAWLAQGLLFLAVSLVVAFLVRRIHEADQRMMRLLDDQRLQAETAAAERGELSDELRRRANSDELTGLVNRTAFLNALQGRLRAATSEAVAVLFVDLDDFKMVNDTLGHSVGDDLIAAVAQRLLTGSRGHDVVARFGGDEFAILLCNLRVEDALRIANRVLGTLKQPFNLCGRLITVRASGGLAVAESGQSRNSVEQHALELLRQADMAMYRSKAENSHSIAVFHDGMQSQMLDRLALESDMRQALGQEQFALEYQPVVDLDTGTVTGVEALLRWTHPGRGVVTPSVFVPIAEQTGIIVPLTLWVVHEACNDLKRWDASPATAGLNVSINVSARLATEPGVGSAIARELHAAGIDPRRIVLEITESLLMEDRMLALQTMCQLRALGMRLSVDDFGTGYSSLSRLNTLPIDEVKIDQSFVGQITQGEAGRTIVRATVAMARGLGLRVVAEGIETSRQLDFLTEIDCDAGQGYLLGRPMPASLIHAFMTDEHDQQSRRRSVVTALPKASLPVESVAGAES